MSDWSGELDMPRPLSSDLTRRDLDSTLLTDDSFESYSLVFSTGTLIVLPRAEDLLTEESSSLRSLSPIVDRLRDEYLSVREGSDIIS